MTSILVVILLQSVQLVCSHGVLTFPKSRNYLARERGDFYCPHCLSGGTAGGGAGPWPYPETAKTSKRHGLCGDRSPLTDPQDFMTGGKYFTGEIAGAFDQGAVVSFEFVLTTHHRGHVEFSVCDKGQATQSCLNEHKLEVVADPEDPLSFVDPDYPNRFMLPPRCAGSNTSPDPLFTSADNQNYRVTLQLPEDLTCQHCVLQWYYVTANSCNAPGYRDLSWPTTYSECAGDGPGMGWWAPSIGDCGETTPEEFWNCADITIGGVTWQKAKKYKLPNGKYKNSKLKNMIKKSRKRKHLQELLNNESTDTVTKQHIEAALAHYNAQQSGSGSNGGNDVPSGEGCCTWDRSQGCQGDDWCGASEERCISCSGDWILRQ